MVVHNSLVALGTLLIETVVTAFVAKGVPDRTCSLLWKPQRQQHLLCLNSFPSELRVAACVGDCAGRTTIAGPTAVLLC